MKKFMQRWPRLRKVRKASRPEIIPSNPQKHQGHGRPIQRFDPFFGAEFLVQSIANGPQHFFSQLVGDEVCLGVPAWKFDQQDMNLSPDF